MENVFPNYTANLHHSSETRVTYACTINVAYLQQEENMKIKKNPQVQWREESHLHSFF